MGILGRGRQTKDQRNGTTVVASGTELVGDLTLADRLHIDGRVKGWIQSESDVSVGRKGRFEGELEARRVLVSGRLKGRVEANRLEIVEGGRVEGEIRVDELVIEPGGRFSGSSEIRSQDRSQGGGRQLGYSRQAIEAIAERGAPGRLAHAPESPDEQPRDQSRSEPPGPDRGGYS